MFRSSARDGISLLCWLWRWHFSDVVEAMSFLLESISHQRLFHKSCSTRLGNKTQLNPSELRGKDLFFGEKAECFHCHGNFNFNDQIVQINSSFLETPFHNTGLYNIGGTGAFPAGNRGVYELSEKPEDMGAFGAPNLRNVEVTAPTSTTAALARLKKWWTSTQPVDATSRPDHRLATAAPIRTRTTSSTTSISMRKSAPTSWRSSGR